MESSGVKAILKVENLAVTIEREEILKDISFTVMPGDVIALIGPNGAGKTVLLKCLLGMMPYRGGVHWAADVKIGYVPQRFQIAKNVPLTVREFFLLHEKKFIFATRAKTDGRIAEALSVVGLGVSELDERLGHLSGGQVQRVLIAWALYDKPNIILFDEPTAGIDIGGQETVYNLLHTLKDRFCITIILVSHELNVVFRYATKVVCINKSMFCTGAPREVLTSGELEKLYGESVYYHPHEHVKS